MWNKRWTLAAEKRRSRFDCSYFILLPIIVRPSQREQSVNIQPRLFLLA
jgi:hypothetical protein